MFGASLGILAQALEIYRKSIDISNRNILNANNPDYAEERPQIKSIYPGGIILEDVTRLQNFYYFKLRNSKLSSVNYLRERTSYNSRVEDIFQEFIEGLGGSEYINNFYNGYIELMKDPNNIGSQENFYNKAKSLAMFLQERKGDLEEFNGDIDYTMRSYVRRINELTKKLAQINKDITVQYAMTYTKGKDYKNLLDERDRYLRELSELINIEIKEDELGRVRVDTSMGFVLVEDQFSWTLRYEAGKLFWQSRDGSEVVLNDIIKGGKVKGLLDFRTDLDNYKQKLDNVAQYLISRVLIPVENGTNWYWLQYTNSPTDPVGISGNMVFDYGGGQFTINYNASDSLTDIANAINSHPSNGGRFNASVVNNPDGTFSLLIQTTDPSYTITDSNNDIYRAEKVFTGTSANDIDVDPQLETNLNNLDFSKTDEFTDLARDWWQGTGDMYRDLINTIASTQNDLKKREEIESALLSSIDTKLKEYQGVSVDKEFLEMMQIKRVYEASAKMVRAIDELLQTTINMV